jgi:hypothetical protein
VSTQCRYMQAAYPDLSAEDTCEGFHRHEDRVYNLARAIAAAVHECEPSDEQVAWFLNDADAVVDDFTPTPETWEVVNHGYPEEEPGLNFAMRVNGVEYVAQESEWEPATPVKRETWESWTRKDEGVAS